MRFRRRGFTILPPRERNETSLVRSIPRLVHTCDACGELTSNVGVCPDCSVRKTDRYDRWE